MPSFTPDSQLELLFDPEFIPTAVKEQLGSDLHIRPLAKTDLSRAHLSVLSVLTSAPDVSETQYAQTFAAMQSCPNTYFTLVIVSRATDTIVGAGTVFLEQKFTRNLGKVGHIEDIVVDKSMQGRKLGLRIINALTGISEALGTYKTILNCNDDNVAFYKKCGYEKKENEMVKYQILTTSPSITTDVSEKPLQTPRL
ncbi:acyl-CoA N-acyltransferase [Phlegmacium glaucopus]|nr:acyl-CoA N-acyltransferase [Phlegmacium glaucopus]